MHAGFKAFDETVTLCVSTYSILIITFILQAIIIEPNLWMGGCTVIVNKETIKHNGNYLLFLGMTMHAPPSIST